MSNRDVRDRILRVLGRYLDLPRLLRENPTIARRDMDRVLAELGIEVPCAVTGSVSSVILYTDGASSGNPGPAGIGVVVTDARGKVLTEISECIGQTTNNVAEYSALIAGLEAAKRFGAEHVMIHADSELLVRQLNGAYKVKSPNIRPHWREAVRRLQALKGWQVRHVPREANQRADALARQAIAEGES